ncbi:aminoglycoside phosphotransferase [Nocardioides litoris]|uniref:aminoglycoside phosphotransferase n=1 Tax=Nocardioides litoris TaxID=1926648 RepID=UPI00111DC659|nr:aminoglycoside phosphotransferase [Nocardioides litoris]
MPAAAPSPEVLDLFAVPGALELLPGGQGGSWRAGDLVFSPDRDPATAAWLSPVLARLSVTLDEDPRRHHRDLRVALPVPARDGSWVVEGWGASRFEPGATPCTDLEVTLAAGRLLHARFAVAVPERPAALAERDDRWARAERLVFGPVDDLLAASTGTPAGPVVERVAAALDPAADLGAVQLVHADLAGNVLLDALGAPLVIDVAPAWRPLAWAEAVAVLDAVLWLGADPAAYDAWAVGARRQALLRAVAWRALADQREDSEALYADVLSVTAST